MKLVNVDKTSEKYKQYMMKKAALIKIVAFLVALLSGAVVSLIIPLRPTMSVLENRNLEKYPQFNVKDFLDGDYFAAVDTWFSDTFPGRDGLMACNEMLTGMYGIRNNVIHGGIVIGDEIPDVDFGEEDLVDFGDIQTDTLNATPSNYGYDSSMAVKAEDIGSSIEVDGDGNGASAKAGESLGSIYVVGDSAYNYYSFSQEMSDSYVSVVNGLAKKLDGKARVYSMIIPTAIDITLDDATRNSISSSNQKKAILYMYSKMDTAVGKCYIYELLRSHRNEYIYFRTDHHWTALGAYYGYSALVTQLGKTPYSLDGFKATDMGKFVGSYYSSTRVSALSDNPDNLIAYGPVSTNEQLMINKEGQVVEYNVVSDVSNWSEGSKYSAFIGGDNPYTEIANPNLADKSSILIIKESFGNALAPFLVENFQNVYVVDYRYYTGKIEELVEEKGIANVVFVNNISTTSTKDRINELKNICE